jgi:hypothetical protein
LLESVLASLKDFLRNPNSFLLFAIIVHSNKSYTNR